MIQNEGIGEVYNYLATLENIISKEIRQVEGNKTYLDKIVPENLVNLYSTKREKALNFTENLYRAVYEASVVTLVASFEKIIFSKYKTTYGSLKSVVKVNTLRDIDFYKTRERFVNDGSKESLGTVITNLMEGHVKADLIEKLKVIKDQRDYIAHGKRFGSAITVDFKLSEIAKILDDILTEIGKP